MIGMLHGGERVSLGSGCRDDNWCNVAFAGGPGGTAWVWGDFLKQASGTAANPSFEHWPGSANVGKHPISPQGRRS